jgi:Flp pilus assembly protein TadB
MTSLAKKTPPFGAQVHIGVPNAAQRSLQTRSGQPNLSTCPRAAACGLIQLTTLAVPVRFPETDSHDPLPEKETDPMTRESIIAGICLLITLGLMWLVDHPNKVAGSVILGIVFCVFILVARLKARNNSRTNRMIRKPPERK